MNPKQKRTKNQIAKAFIELLSRHSFDSITIVSLTQATGVATVSYYRNFASKEAVLQYYLDGLFSAYINELQAHHELKLKDFFESFFRFFGQNALFVNSLIRDDRTYLLMYAFRTYLDTIFSMLTRKNTTQTVNMPDQYTKLMLAGGLYYTLIEWIKDPNRPNPSVLGKQLALSYR